MSNDKPVDKSEPDPIKTTLISKDDRTASLLRWLVDESNANQGNPQEDVTTQEPAEKVVLIRPARRTLTDKQKKNLIPLLKSRWDKIDPKYRPKPITDDE